MRFRERISRCMAGRYGWDRLNVVMTWTALGLMALSLFFGHHPAVFYALGGVAWLLVLLTLLRAFSRRIPSRQKENAVLTRLLDGIAARLRLQKNKFRDRRTHVYRRCPGCRAVLRLPRRRGRHAVTCPRCRRHFEVFILFPGRPPREPKAPRR